MSSAHMITVGKEIDKWEEVGHSAKICLGNEQRATPYQDSAASEVIMSFLHFLQKVAMISAKHFYGVTSEHCNTNNGLYP